MAFSFRQVRYFIAVADAGKVSAAAANLHVSQSAVSAAIDKLEKDIEAPLFRRRSNGVELTYEGHQFLTHAQNIMAAVSEATRGVRRSGRSLRGQVKVGLTYTVAGYFFPQLLMRFSRSFPDVEFKLVEKQRTQIEEEIVSGELDIAVILVSNLQNVGEISSRVLIKSQRRLWLSADHHLMNEDVVELSQIAKEPYVMLTVDEAEKSALRYWSATDYSPNVIFKTSSVEAVRSMVATGTGITILSDMVYRPWSLEGQHVEVKPVAGQVHSMDVGLIWKRGKEMNPQTKALYSFLCNNFVDTGYGVGEPTQ